MRYAIIPVVGLVVAAGTLPAQGRTGADTARAPARKDYTAPLGAGYTAHDVTIPTPMGHTLAGTLTLPNAASAANKVGAVVTMTGSGQQDRDESLPTPPG